MSWKPSTPRCAASPSTPTSPTWRYSLPSSARSDRRTARTSVRSSTPGLPRASHRVAVMDVERPPAAAPTPLKARAGARWRKFRERPLLPLLSGATLILVAPVVGVGVIEGMDDRAVNLSSNDRDDSLEALERRRDERRQGTPLREAGPAGAAIEPAPTDRARRCPAQRSAAEARRGAGPGKTASMTLSTEPDEVDDVADGVVEVTERYDGHRRLLQRHHDCRRGPRELRPARPDRRTSRPPWPTSRTSPASRRETRAPSTSRRPSSPPRSASTTQRPRSSPARPARRGGLHDRDRRDQAAAGGRPRRARGRARRARRSEAARRLLDVNVTVVGDGDADGWSLGDAADEHGNVLEDIAGAGLVALAVIVPLGAGRRPRRARPDAGSAPAPRGRARRLRAYSW